MSRLVYQDGSLVTTSLPLRGVGPDPLMMPGPIRGVVLDVSTANGTTTCTVLPYAGTGRPMYDVPVAAGGGPHQGTSWVPNPSTVRLLDVASAAELDGDHVVVSFLGGRATDPIITGRLPHPRATYAPAAESPTIPASGRHPAVADVGTVYQRHAGTVAMMDRRGNVVVDTTAAPQKPDGTAAGGSEGKASVIVQLAQTSRLEVRVGDDVILVVEDGQVKAGPSPTMHGVLFEALKALFDAHVHPTAFGPSGVPTVALADTCKSPGVLLDAP